MAPAALLLSLLAPALLFSNAVLAHQKPIEVDEHADWATRHLAEEHHISNFDAGAFFQLHDFDNSGYWDFDELHSTYGFKHESTNNIDAVHKDGAVDEVIKMLDRDGDKQITREEWFAFVRGGGTLPDFGMGPGHHGDDEYEYEIHHWEKYHDENTREEDLIHPEDIEHFKKHDEMADEEDRIAALNRRAIVEENIPQKFRVTN